MLSIDICMLALMQSLMLKILECMSKAIQVESQDLRWEDSRLACGMPRPTHRHAAAAFGSMRLHGNAGQTLVVCLRFSEDKAMSLLR